MLKGLGAILPLALCIYLLYWFFSKAEAVMKSLFLSVVPLDFYFPGLGMLLALVLLFASGLLVQTFLIRYFLEQAEKLIDRIPLVKSLYSGVKDFVGFVSAPSGSDNRKVVAVSMPDGSKLIGLVTGDSAAKQLFQGEDANRVAVYMPMSYQIAGYTVYVQRERLELLDISVEEALRICMTAGMGASEDLGSVNLAQKRAD